MGDVLTFSQKPKLSPGQRPPRKSWLAERTDAERVALLDEDTASLIAHAKEGEPLAGALVQSFDAVTGKLDWQVRLDADGRLVTEGEPQPKGVA